MSEPAQHVLPPSWQLSEKVAVVTGGSRGIGRAIATTLAARGAKVAVNYTKNEAAAAAVVDAIKAAGGEAMAIGFDVADPAAVDAGIKAVKEAFGGLHILVNNAGISIDALLLRASLDDLHKTLAINLSGAFTCAKAAARHLLRARADGRIINISSVVGEQGNAGQSMYAASKAGLIGLTKSLARELVSRLAILLAHLAKWHWQPGERSRSWLTTIGHQRDEIAALLEDNPSLRPNLDDAMAKAWSRARRQAARETGIALTVFPTACPFTLDDVLADAWLPDTTAGS